MSATQERRAIRRAFGPEAAAVIREHQELITGHHLAIAELIKTRDQMRQEVAEMQASHEALSDSLKAATQHFEETIQEAADALQAKLPMTFFGRVRWLVIGR